MSQQVDVHLVMPRWCHLVGVLLTSAMTAYENSWLVSNSRVWIAWWEPTILTSRFFVQALFAPRTQLGHSSSRSSRLRHPSRPTATRLLQSSPLFRLSTPLLPHRRAWLPLSSLAAPLRNLPKCHFQHRRCKLSRLLARSSLSASHCRLRMMMRHLHHHHRDITCDGDSLPRCVTRPLPWCRPFQISPSRISKQAR